MRTSDGSDVRPAQAMPARAAAKAQVARDYWDIDFAEAPPCANREGVLVEYVVRRLSDETYAAAMQTGREREALYDQRLDRWAVLSPALALRRSMEAIAGVAPARQRAFEAQAIDYHAQWRNRVTDALFACRQFSRADFDEAPRFDWREVRSGVTAWSGVALMAGLALLLGWFALRRGALFR